MSPSKYFSFKATTFFLKILLFLEALLKSNLGIANSFVTFLFISSTSSNLPFREFFTLRNSQKSQEVKSRLYGKWCSWTIPYFIRNYWIRCDKWAGALYCDEAPSCRFSKTQAISFLLRQVIASDLLDNTHCSSSDFLKCIHDEQHLLTQI